MHRRLNRLGLSLLLTLGVIAWNQQQTHSFSQSPSYRSSLFSVAQATSTATTSDEAQQVIEAVRAGDVAAVRVALDKGASPDAGDIYSGFALSYAAGAGHLEVMQLLLEQGANVNISADEGYTPLMEATLNQQTAAVQLLLAHEADPNRVAAGQTPLAAAVSLGNVELAQVLLAGGANVRQPSQGQSLLQIARQQGDAAMINLIQTAQAEGNSGTNHSNFMQ